VTIAVQRFARATVSTSARFRAAREHAGLSIAETAARTGVSEPSVWDLETHDDELMMVYSPGELQRFAGAFSVAPRELVGTEEHDDHPVSANELASAIREHCQMRNMTLVAIGDAAGWDVSEAANAPELLLSDFSIDGIRDICRELRRSKTHTECLGSAMVRSAPLALAWRSRTAWLSVGAKSRANNVATAS
jgi:transcriptional regulator with XRE-family HTH domain